MLRARVFQAALIGAALLTTASTVSAQAYPSRPVRFVVPYAPGEVAASAGIYTDRVKVSWNAPDYASGYTLWRSGTNDVNGASSVAAGIASTNYSDSNAVPGVLYYYWVKATNSSGTSVFSASAPGWRLDISAGVCADYDGDRLADPTVYDEVNGIWKVKLSSANYYQVATALNGLGGRGLASVSADYDGDRLADPAVYNEVAGAWMAMPSSAGYAVVIIASQPFGGIGYTAMPADYDGDRLADPGVYGRAGGDWKVMLSSENYQPGNLDGLLGGPGFRAVAADYDGDMKADPAVYAENTGIWIIKLSSIGYVAVAVTQVLGGPGYSPVPADYDGDGFADPAVKSEAGSQWQAMLSTAGYTVIPVTLVFE